ncbi:DUF6735 family protein [Halobellus ruber]
MGHRALVAYERTDGQYTLLNNRFKMEEPNHSSL